MFRRVSRLVLLAIVLQVAIPLVHQPAAAQPGRFGQLGPICHVAGTAPVDPAHQLPAPQVPACPICAILQALGAGFTPPDAIVAAAPANYSRAFHFFPDESLVSSWTGCAGQPRAPPAIS